MPPILKKMQLDIIFLDIDGVLNPDKDKFPDVFDPECVKQLRRILDHSPQSHVVFSTSWRTGFSFFVLGWLWHQHELPVTRVIRTVNEIRNHRYDMLRRYFRDSGAGYLDDSNAPSEELHSVVLPPHAWAVGRSIAELERRGSKAAVSAVRRDGIVGREPRADTVL